MNLSGQAVAAAAKYYGVEPARIIAVCGDVTLEPGVIRIRRDGSCGGIIRNYFDSKTVIE